MEARLTSMFAKSRERKRRRDVIDQAFEELRSTATQELTETNYTRSDDIIALLCVKFGWKTVFTVGRLLSQLPPVVASHIEQQILSGSFAELEKTLTLDEIHVIANMLRKCDDFLEFSYEKSLASISKTAGIPLHRILYPPTSVCFTCGWSLQLQSHPARVTVFETVEPLPGVKFTLRCRNCNLHYGYSMYGNGEEGYRFYEKRRPYIESSNVTYLSRDLCLQQIRLV